MTSECRFIQNLNPSELQTLPESLAKHLQSCPDCRSYAELMLYLKSELLPLPEAPSPEKRSRNIQEIQRRVFRERILSPLRRLGTGLAAAAVLLAVLLNFSLQNPSSSESAYISDTDWLLLESSLSFSLEDLEEEEIIDYLAAAGMTYFPDDPGIYPSLH